jgi:uncharacterized protein YbbC (DUF1343 family)
MRFRFGIDILIQERINLIAGRRIGLITNASGVTCDLTANLDALRKAPGVQMAALFSPEHGLYGAEADGAAVASSTDGATGLPIYSLYGDVRRPTPEQLDGLDVLVFDIQCVGARFYTYITTLLYAMQAAAEHELPFIVCDRPNPIGGEIVEGPILEPGFESFVGPGPLPIRYGLTPGELARLYNAEWGVGCDLTVVPCTGWGRWMFFEDLHIPWVPPSPAMPWPETASVYPGMCLVEGTSLSEGRGTALPFHLAGAPGIDGGRLADALNEQELDGVRFCPVIFEPCSGKWAGQRCGGIQVHVTHRRNLRPVSVGLHVLAAVRRLFPELFEYHPSSRDADHLTIDLLAGTAGVRQALDQGASVPDLVSGWSEALDRFVATTRPYRLYS